MKEKELIDHLKEVMQAHEEPYKEGSWEHFAASTSTTYIHKKRFPYWAAAVIVFAILGAGIWALYNLNSNQQASVINNTGNPIKTIDSQYVTFNKSDVKIVSNNNEKTSTIKNEKSFFRKVIDHIISTNNNNGQPVKLSNDEYKDEIEVQKNTIVENNTKFVQPQSKEPTTKENIAQNNTHNITQQPVQQPNATYNNMYTQNNPIIEEDNNNFKKWMLAAQVASSLGNNSKVNMSFGINVGYAFNDKVSIHSGAAFSQLNSALHTTTAPANNFPALSDKKENIPMSRNSFFLQENSGNNTHLESSELILSGVEIPIEMRYKINKNLYTNVGVSAIALIDNKQKNTYLHESKRPVGFSLSSETTTNDVMERTQETISGNNVVNDKLLEFFNVSFGYKQPISNKKNIRIEPFIKLPISNTGIKAPLTNAGIRLGLDL